MLRLWASRIFHQVNRPQPGAYLGALSETQALWGHLLAFRVTVLAGQKVPWASECQLSHPRPWLWSARWHLSAQSH